MSEELARYKARMAGLYDRAAPTYGQVGPPYFQHVGRRLVELAGVGPGWRVLDVGCGRGAVLFAAADLGASVLGIDISPEMVRETTAEIDRRGVVGVEVRLGDAEALDLPALRAFDAVLCASAIWFFADLEGLLAEWARALRPGGVVGLALADDMDPRWAWQNELMMKHGRIEEPPAPLAGRRLRAPGALAEPMRAAGLADVREVREQIGLVYRDADEWWEALWTHGSRVALESMSPEGLAQFRADGTARIQAMAREAGLEQRMGLIFVLGRAPG